MIDLKEIQKEVIENKRQKGFNTTDVGLEFALTHEELSEAFHAYRKNLPDTGEELADVLIYLLGISEILGLDLEKELKNKMEINKNRKYELIDDVYSRIEDD